MQGRIEPARQSERELIWLLSLLSATTALGIDMILPAFTEIRADLGMAADSPRIALTVTTYFVGLSVCQLLYGPLSDRFGRKPVLWAGLAVYVVGGVGAATSSSFGWLVASRLLWGVGAAAPRVILLAVARDLYEGDQLGRIIALTAAVFMIVPTIGPALGEALLAVGSWRLVMITPAVVAIGLACWVGRLQESLPPERRTPLELTRIASGARRVLALTVPRTTILILIADFGSFSAFLGSSAIIFDDVFDRSGLFAICFGVMSIGMGLAGWLASRLVPRVGSARLIWATASLSAAGGVALAALSLTADIPSFWVWFVVLAGVNSARMPLSALLQAQAMQPLGEMAGTASALLGAASLGFGAIIGGVIDQWQSGSTVPLSIGYAVTGVLVLFLVAVTQRAVALERSRLGAVRT